MKDLKIENEFGKDFYSPQYIKLKNQLFNYRFRKKMIEQIEQLIMDGVDLEWDRLGEYRSKMAKNIIALFEKAGWKAPGDDENEPEKEALIRENVE